jgi:hypothetical protein
MFAGGGKDIADIYSVKTMDYSLRSWIGVTDMGE